MKVSSIKAATREQDLGQLWADAYTCWILGDGDGAPCAKDGTRVKTQLLYMCPQDDKQQGETQQQQQPPLDWPPAILKLPHQYSIIELTAYNPLGAELPLARNRQANAALEQDLRDLVVAQSTTTSACCYWPSFGFGGDWQEHGFAVGCSADEQRTAVLDLATKYQQGAVYEYSIKKQHGGATITVLRNTVPVVMDSAVQARVKVVPCAQPPIPESEPYYLANKQQS